MTLLLFGMFRDYLWCTKFVQHVLQEKTDCNVPKNTAMTQNSEHGLPINGGYRRRETNEDDHKEKLDNIGYVWGQKVEATCCCLPYKDFQNQLISQQYNSWYFAK
jgi:hypothetical protein